jgi:hypothetical protein
VSCPADPKQIGGGERGEIEVFSRASRRRLFRELHKLIFKTVTFITLTYPSEFPVACKVYKANLKEYRRRFEIKWGAARAIWRLEFQKRGAPHFHIMYLDLPFIPVWEIAWMWKCVCHTWDMAHEVNGVDLKLITDAREGRLIAQYLSKYIAKVDERSGKHDREHTGRWWGRWNIVDERKMEFETTDWEAERIVTFVLSLRRGDGLWEPVDRSLCSIFGDNLGSSEFSERVVQLVGYVKNR